MKILVFIIFCFGELTSFSQPRRFEYIAIYETKIKSKLKIQLDSPKKVTKEDSILSAFGEFFITELEQKEFIFTLVDSLRTSNDTTYIKSSAENNTLEEQQTSVNVNLKDNERILFNNKFLIKDDTTNLFKPIAESYEVFKFFGEGTLVLGYKTKIFQNESGTIKIWISKGLPKKLNPAIRILNPPGAILKYEIVNGGQTTTSSLKSLSKKN